jgi:hypothetical protein
LVPGETVTISGTGWPENRQLQAATCGGGAQATSQDCDLAHAVDFTTAGDGMPEAALVVTIPPAPCPCVVMVTQTVPSTVRFLPITIVGAPTSPVVQPPPQNPAVTISHVHVVSESSWTSWFGAAAPRELVLTVHNGATYPVRPLLVAQWIQGSSNHVIASPTPRTLPVGGTAQITAPFALSTFAHGDFEVVGRVTGGDFEDGFASTGDRFAITTSTDPWALYAAGIVLGTGVVVMVLASSIRRRRGYTNQPDVSVPIDPHDDPATRLSHIGAAR